MKNLNKNKLVEEILACLWPLESPSGDQTIQSSAMFFMRDDWMLYFGADEAKAFQSSLGRVLAYDSLTDKYSSKATRARFESLLVGLITTNEDRPSNKYISQEVDSWLNTMLTAGSHEFEYFGLIENLLVDSRRSIGKVTLEPVSDATIGRITDLIFGQIDENPSYTDEERTNLKNSLYEGSLSKLEEQESASLISTTITVLDVDKGLEVANDRFSEVLDLLRFLGAFVFRPTPTRPIGLQGEVSVEGRFNLAISPSQGFKIFHRALSVPFKFNGERSTQFEQLGLSNFSQILRRDPSQRSELDSRLVNAIHWCAEAIREVSDAERFLKFCISLESLLCARGEQPLGGTIGERAAFLLESGAESRQSLFQRFKKIYGVRSSLAHEGLPQREDDVVELLPHLFAISIRSIVEIGNLVSIRSWGTYSELREHFEELKFG